MGVSTARKVGAFLIHATREDGRFLTHLELQKLIYYCQAWHLANFNEPLFDDPIEPWEHGPVVSGVYQQYRRFEDQPIIMSPSVPDMKRATERFIKKVIDKYSGYTAWELRNRTHLEEPWREANRKGNYEISQRTMKSHFRKKISKGLIEMNDIHVGDVHLKLKKPLRLTPMFDKESLLVFVKHESLGIDLYGFSRRNLEKELPHHIMMLWEEYALEDDERLSEDAIELKRNLLKAIKVIDNGN